MPVAVRSQCKLQCLCGVILSFTLVPWFVLALMLTRYVGPICGLWPSKLLLAQKQQRATAYVFHSMQLLFTKTIQIECGHQWCEYYPMPEYTAI
jgi:hypothetical protein